MSGQAVPPAEFDGGIEGGIEARDVDAGPGRRNGPCLGRIGNPRGLRRQGDGGAGDGDQDGDEERTGVGGARGSGARHESHAHRAKPPRSTTARPMSRRRSWVRHLRRAPGSRGPTALCRHPVGACGGVVALPPLATIECPMVIGKIVHLGLPTEVPASRPPPRATCSTELSPESGVEPRGVEPPTSRVRFRLEGPWALRFWAVGVQIAAGCGRTRNPPRFSARFLPRPW